MRPDEQSNTTVLLYREGEKIATIAPPGVQTLDPQVLDFFENGVTNSHSRFDL